MKATQRKLKTLEAQMWQHIHACQDAALRQLTDSELDLLCETFEVYPDLEQLNICQIPTMPRPAKLTPEAWAVLQRFATLFMHIYRETPHAHTTATHPTA